jgi:putative protease
MLEIQSPAGSVEAVIAAVQSGADALYLGFDSQSARNGEGDFSLTDLEKALRYCRIRGCKVYVTVNAILSDRELPGAAKLIRAAAQAGADAFLLQDLGLAGIVRAVAPGVPIHASAKLGFHNPDGLRAARELGFSRVMLPRELSYEQLCRLAVNAPVELGVTVHGFLCAGYSGQCYMGSFVDGRGGNRGQCSQPCGRELSTGSRLDNYPLSLKDLCLIQHLEELEAAGITSIKIRGRQNRPEYAAIVTELYTKAVREKILPTQEELNTLQRAFSPCGFTDGYFSGRDEDSMFGPPEQENSREVRRFIHEIKKGYADRELRRVPVNFYAKLQAGEPSKFVAEDRAGNQAALLGPVPMPSPMPLTQEELKAVFYKTGGTPYTCANVVCSMDESVHLTEQQLTEVRTGLLSKLTGLRKAPVSLQPGTFPPPPVPLRQSQAPAIIFQVTSAEQLTPELAALNPDYLYVPLELLVSNYEKVFPFVQCGARPVAVLPRIITEAEQNTVTGLLERAITLGVKEALVNNLGHILLARALGLDIRGDYGLNSFNSYTLQVLEKAHFLSATASFELKLSQVRALLKPLNTELIVYGRLPLMLTESCIIRRSSGKCTCEHTPCTLSDKFGAVYPVMKEFGCRNMIYHSSKLYLADRQMDLAGCGLWGYRLLFTTESPRECVTVAKSYMDPPGHRPNGPTRGVYYKGVE